MTLFLPRPWPNEQNRHFKGHLLPCLQKMSWLHTPKYAPNSFFFDSVVTAPLKCRFTSWVLPKNDFLIDLDESLNTLKLQFPTLGWFVHRRRRR